jgi:hypothetical protein
MKPTELVYSSHDRCEYLHRDWIVERALRSWTNKTLFYLPFSSGQQGDQEYSWGTFSGYLDRFRQYGLEPRSMIWSESMSQEDADRCFRWLSESEVVILGGGSTAIGLRRYDGLGERFFNDPERMLRALKDRRARGLLTVGFSSGADQLCEWSCDFDDPVHCYGRVRQVITRLHHDWGGEGQVQELVRRHPECLVFGLPNDSGIAVEEGVTGRGHHWQRLRFVVDASWDRPEDQWHIKTRQGLRVLHRYADGREWKFNDGDTLVRVFHADGGQEAWIGLPHLPVYLGYLDQEPTGFHSLEEIVASR